MKFLRFLISISLYWFAAYVIKITLPQYFSPYIFAACFVVMCAVIFYVTVWKSD